MFFSVVSFARADFEDGVAAYQAGDYATAFSAFECLAERNIVVAQTNLGYMYTMEEGVDVDLEQAYFWFRRAAENKSSAEQMTVASMLYHGEGVVADPIEAYAWFSVAGASGQEKRLIGLRVYTADRDQHDNQIRPVNLIIVSQLVAKFVDESGRIHHSSHQLGVKNGTFFIALAPFDSAPSCFSTARESFRGFPVAWAQA